MWAQQALSQPLASALCCPPDPRDNAQSSGCTEQRWSRRCPVPAPSLSPATCSPQSPAPGVPQPLVTGHFDHSMVKGSPHKAPPQLGAAIPSQSCTLQGSSPPSHHPKHSMREEIRDALVWGLLSSTGFFCH